MARSEPPTVPVSLAVGILYVVGAPAGNLDDLTYRARRTLGEAALVVAEDQSLGQKLLVRHGLTTPLFTLLPSIGADDLNALLNTLANRDVALLTSGWSVGPLQASQRLICAAVAREIRVLAVPGPSFPIAALVISGLPTDSFVYLHRLPQEAEARRALLHAVSYERRTLVLLDALDGLPELYEAFGDRELAVVASLEEEGARVAWQGPLSSALEEFADRAAGWPCAVVVGGAPETARWDEEKVRQQIQALLERGHGAKAISQQLATESGWPRRQVYQLALSVRKDSPDSTKTVTG